MIDRVYTAAYACQPELMIFTVLDIVTGDSVDLVAPAKPACRLPGMIIWSVSGVQLCTSRAMYIKERGTNIQSECIVLTVKRCRGSNSICSDHARF